MLKRCTNSACRSSFSIVGFLGECPRCGKKYPHLYGRHSASTLLLYSYGSSKITVDQAARMLTGCGLADAKKLTESVLQKTPVCIGIRCPEKRGEAELMLKEANAIYRLRFLMLSF